MLLSIATPAFVAFGKPIIISKIIIIIIIYYFHASTKTHQFVAPVKPLVGVGVSVPSWHRWQLVGLQQ